MSRPLIPLLLGSWTQPEHHAIWYRMLKSAASISYALPLEPKLRQDKFQKRFYLEIEMTYFGKIRPEF